jgi:cystathionine beta-lyase
MRRLRQTYSVGGHLVPTPKTEIQYLGDDRRHHYGAVSTPVYRASLFSFETYQDFLDAFAGVSEVPHYSRVSNPTREALEVKIAHLEKTDRAIAFSSGMAAISAVLFSLVKAGDHILVVSCAYGPTRQICDTMLPDWGVEVEYFEPGEACDLSDRRKPNTRLIYLESPSSSTFQIQDIRATTRLARANNIITVLDNSWATPLFQQPITMGVDIVVHSGTKYIAGHSDVVVGLLACSNELYEIIKPVAVLLGAGLSPDDAYLVNRGLRTLPIRLAQQEASALKIARWLETRPEVKEVVHPGLPSYPEYDLAQSQMQGTTSLFAFKLEPANEAAQHAFVNSLNYFSIAVSWGGFESLILPRPNWSNGNSDAQQGSSLEHEAYRICIGLEDPDDLIADLERGFEARAFVSSETKT